MPTRTANLRSLPSVDRLARHPDLARAIERYPAPLMTEAVRRVLERARADAVRGGAVPGIDELASRALEELRAAAAPSLRPVVNASGVVLHTNLGRATLAAEAMQAVAAVAAQASNLEYDLAGGGRGERDDHVEAHLCALTGAEGRGRPCSGAQRVGV